MDLNECAGEGMYLPTDECDDCDALIGRVTDLEQNKQDKLTAGENITINGNVISSTGGGKTYTAGTNIAINDTVISAPNVYNKTEVNDLISGVSSIRIEVVDALPATGEPNVIYLLNDGADNYEQWVYTQTDGWIDLGGEEVDLSNYYTKAQADALLAAKQNTLTAGSNITISGNTISATDTKYTAGTNVSISGANVISATDTTYTAGTNISISGSNVISAPNVYTKTETNTLLNAKQNTLTAGDNVTITNNVVSVPVTRAIEELSPGSKISTIRGRLTYDSLTKRVSIFLAFVATDTFATTDPIATVPEAYRPAGQRTGACYLESRTGASETTVAGACLVNTDGTLVQRLSAFALRGLLHIEYFL